ncbi:MAG: YbbR-like domain-containing protein [Flavobacteriaceae bacterium]|nr:YbbR-like domain-containing protein [Flavobacteriaceae bacterium]
MSVIKSKVIKSFQNRRINVLLFFFLIAFLFSILTKLSETYNKTISFSINPLHIPEDKVVLLDSTHVIDVTVTSKGFDLVKYYFSKPILDVDFRWLELHESHYLWKEGNQLSNIIDQLDHDFKIKNITPDSLLFKYDSNAIKEVPVQLNQNVKFKSGFDIVGTFKLQPSTIKLIGPKSIIDTISYVPTTTLKSGEVQSSIQKKIKIDKTSIPPEVNFSHNMVSVSAVVDKFTEGSISVPITLINAPQNLTVKFYPKKVDVIFYTSLGYYKHITDKNFTITCDYVSDTHQNYLIPKVTKMPKNVKNVRLNTNKIEYIVVK